MQQMTFRVPEEIATEIEEVASERDVSKSEVAREFLTLGTEYDDLQAENDRLHRRIEALIQQRDEHTELVNAVKEDRTLAQRKHDASLTTRLRWLFFGGDED